MKNELLDIISNLPSDEKRVIDLYYGINGENLHSIKEIASLMQKSVDHIYVLKRKALMEIRKRFI